MCTFACKIRIFTLLMKKHVYIISALATMLLTSCAQEFNKVYKSNDYAYRYEYAKEQYAKGKYQNAATILGDMVTIFKGKDNAEECLYLYGMANLLNRDNESAAQVFRKYHTSYPKGIYAEDAYVNIGEAIYQTIPEPRLDQSQTYQAMKAYQEFIDLYPYSEKKDLAQDRLYELQDLLVQKELINAQLYYDLGTYFGNCTSGGNNYEACIVTSQNAIKDYPYTNLRENFATLIMKSKYKLAVHSVKEKQHDRFQDAEDECYGFLNEYPESAEKATAEKYIANCKRYTKTGEIDLKDKDNK